MKKLINILSSVAFAALLLSSSLPTKSAVVKEYSLDCPSYALGYTDALCSFISCTAESRAYIFNKAKNKCEADQEL